MGHLDEEGGGRLVHVQLGRGRLEVAHAEPAAAQRARRRRTPVVEEQLDPPHRLEGRGRRGAVDQRRAPVRGGERGELAHGLAGRVAAAQRQPHLSGQLDHAAAAGDQQLAGEQLLGRRGRLLGQQGVPRAPGGRLAAVLVDMLEQGAGGAADLGEAARDLGRRRRLGGDRAEAAHPDRRGADQPVRDPAEGAQPGGGLPDEREVGQPGDRRAHGLGLGMDDGRQVLLSGLARDHQGI